MIRDEVQPGGQPAFDVDESPRTERLDVEERDGENFIHEFAAHFGINELAALEMMEYLDRNGGGRTEGSMARDIMRRELEHRKGIFATITNYDGNKQFAVWCVIYAHSWAPILLADKAGRPIKTMQQIADFFDCTKENVRKLVDKIQADNDLPKVPGQREEEGCKHMSEARVKQLRAAEQG